MSAIQLFRRFQRLGALVCGLMLIAFTGLVLYSVVMRYLFTPPIWGEEIPKLLFYAEPGGIISESTVAWCRENFKNLDTVNIGPGIHYLQEDNPHLIGSELARWYRGL